MLKPFVVKNEKIANTANPHLKIVEATLQTPINTEVRWGYVKTHDAAILFAQDQENNVYLKREWRLTSKAFIWELPAGFIEDENPTEEQILKAANRELQEEIGVKANKMEKLITVYPSNYLTMRSHIFLAEDLTESKLKGDEHEYLEVTKLPINKAYELVTQNQIPNSQTVIAFELMFKRLGIK